MIVAGFIPLPAVIFGKEPEMRDDLHWAAVFWFRGTCSGSQTPQCVVPLASRQGMTFIACRRCPAMSLINLDDNADPIPPHLISKQK
jgi:hypothetical protein